MQSPTPIKVDLLIFGGGIAGLWLLNRLTALGYNAILAENNTLGGEQTIHSQGIIHGGLKYALSGTLNSEADAIAEMPDTWRKCLDGTGEIDLRDVQVLSDTQYMWSPGSLASSFSTFFASKLLRGRIQKESKNTLPSALNNKKFKGSAYRLSDLVIDTPSLLNALIKPQQQRLLKIDSAQFTIHQKQIKKVTLLNQQQALSIEPQQVLFCAGLGNEALIEQVRQEMELQQKTQNRPLQMAIVKHKLPHHFYGHCIGTSNKPRVTITTHPTGEKDNPLAWYIGGDLAEKGANESAETFLKHTKKELKVLFPWLDFSDAEFTSCHISRGEPKQNSLTKPDAAITVQNQNLIMCWPTKLTLAPDLSNKVIQQLKDMNCTPTNSDCIPDSFPRALTTHTIWNR